MSNNKHWAVITGASSGIGKCMAVELAGRGYNVIVTARRASRLTDLCEKLETSYGVQAVAVPNDLSNPEGANMLVEEINKLSIKPSILINNAGKGHFGPFTEFSLEDHQGDIQLNISSLVSLTYQMIPLLEQAPGPKHIMNVASVVSYISLPNYAVYSGTKRFVRHFSEALKFELKKKKIDVSCLCPGGTQTEFMDQAGQKMNEDSKSVMMSPEEVAKIGVEGMLQKKTAIVTGMMNKFLCFLPRVLPSDFTVGLSYKVMSKYASSDKEKEML